MKADLYQRVTDQIVSSLDAMRTWRDGLSEFSKKQVHRGGIEPGHHQGDTGVACRAYGPDDPSRLVAALPPTSPLFDPAPVLFSADDILGPHHLWHECRYVEEPPSQHPRKIAFWRPNTNVQNHISVVLTFALQSARHLFLSKSADPLPWIDSSPGRMSPDLRVGHQDLMQSRQLNTPSLADGSMRASRVCAMASYAGGKLDRKALVRSGWHGSRTASCSPAKQSKPLPC
jgi:hypothetical protein